jgi:hypothetical protein
VLFGRPYHKATVWFVCKKYNAVSQSLHDHFCGYGCTRQGLWPKFAAAIRGSESVLASDGEDSDKTDETSLSDAEKDVMRRFKRIGSRGHSSPVSVQVEKESDNEPTSPDMSAICPYCEGELPTEPLETLQALRKELDLDINSHALPTMTCNYACEAKEGNITLLACHCEQHMFETQHHLP